MIYYSDKQSDFEDTFKFLRINGFLTPSSYNSSTL